MPSFFVAARSSRHRQACFALYRSLLRQAARVPLPDDLTTASPLGPTTNPLRTLIRNGFRRNKRDTSPRLIVSALKNGYRNLTLLSRAADPPTAGAAEHASVLAFLHENQARVLALRAKTAAASSPVSTAPIPGRVTVLTRVVSEEGQEGQEGQGRKTSYHYVPTALPRPLSAFRSGVRKPPTLAATSVGDVPFLRFGGPQPRFLERVLRQRGTRRAKRITKVLEMEGDGMEAAGWEDEWEEMVERLLREEGQAGGGEGEGEGEVGMENEDWGGEEEEEEEKDSNGDEMEENSEDEKEVTYRGSLEEAVTYLRRILADEGLDMIARAKAMLQIMVAEQEMALNEEKERLVREGREGEEPMLRVWRRPVWAGRRRKGSTEKTQGDESQEQGASGEQAERTGTPEQP